MSQFGSRLRRVALSSLHAFATPRPPVGKKKTEKQLASLAAARDLKNACSSKENILGHSASPPRATTRAQQTISTLRDKINDQNLQILILSSENSGLVAENSRLSTNLHRATLLNSSLEERNSSLSHELGVVKGDLEDARDRIFEQESLIRQKNQRINRLMRDKSFLAAKLACIKQQLLAAVVRAEAAETLSASGSLRIESHILTIARLDKALSSHRQKNKDLYKSLRATEMREKRAKTPVQKLRKDLKQRAKWSGMNRRTYTSQYRSLALAFTRAGCAQARLGPLLVRVGKIVGVKIKRAMSWDQS
ncbi:hypothetical protein B0H13DRAFT_2373916 [Mycena leptocephala]|nr:hypothetical protein B0H13DRAFT_2373916 [Mycena leptocephala]